MMFSTFRPAVEHVLKSFAVEQTTEFKQFVRDELAEVSSDIRHRQPEKKQLNTLYDLRARYLDWELGTGYLGFFSKHPGTRYTFTKRLEVVFQMIPSIRTRRVLEIGCGAGLLCLELAQQAETVIGIDISRFVLNFANHVQEYIQYSNVSFQHGDAENLAFQDESFDLVICSEVLEHLLNPQQALVEIRRVVKRGGTVILTTPCALSFSDMFMSVFRLFNKHVESEKDVQFDKKTYLALKRNRQRSSQGQKHVLEKEIKDEVFMRVHERFSYSELIATFQQTGFDVEHSLGTVFAFPPHYQVFYRYCPGFMLPGVRCIEYILNRMNGFQRFGSVTTCFRLKRRERV